MVFDYPANITDQSLSEKLPVQSTARIRIHFVRPPRGVHLQSNAGREQLHFFFVSLLDLSELRQST